MYFKMKLMGTASVNGHGSCGPEPKDEPKHTKNVKKSRDVAQRVLIGPMARPLLFIN